MIPESIDKDPNKVYNTNRNDACVLRTRTARKPNIGKNGNNKHSNRGENKKILDVMKKNTKDNSIQSKKNEYSDLTFKEYDQLYNIQRGINNKVKYKNGREMPSIPIE